MDPRCINVQEAKTHLSALLARVAAGERIVLARHGKPIVACNAAIYWQALRQIGITDPIPGFGTLLRDH